ncbi:MAG: helix-turn-helix domain-containing protein, partial [Afipia sp.]
GDPRQLHGNSKMSTTSDADAREQRRLQVSALLVAGASQREIAEELGVSVGTINTDVKALRREWGRQQGKNMADYVHLDLVRLDVAISSIWNAVLAGSLDAIETLIGLIQTRAKIIGYPGVLRELYDEERGKQPLPGVTVNMFGGGANSTKLPEMDVKLIQSLSELPPEGLQVYLQNMLVATQRQAPVIIDASYSNQEEEE